MRREEKGITLIALIITIVVMLILVAVSINILVNSNLIGHAEKTGDAYAGAIKNEEKLGNDGITVNGKKYANVEDVAKGKVLIESNIPGGTKVDENKEYAIKGETRTAVIPGGFTVSGIDSERIIEEGLVIYLIPDDEVESVKWDGTEKTKYDQFVWIPVSNANNMFMCQAKTADTMCNLKIEGNEVICQTHKTADTTKSKKMAGRLYATSTGENFNSSLTTQVYNANSGLREPAIVTGTEDGAGKQYDGSSSNNIGLTLDTLQEEYNSAVKKVIQSGGFWVGRYETSGMSSSNSNDSTTILSVVAGKGTSDGINRRTWYRMYKQQQNYANKKGLATEENTSIQSTMIFGAAYDQIVKYANCASETTPTKDYSAVKTGNVPTDCYKNIYDLCGNLNEWTTEANSTNNRVNRRGNYSFSASASHRSSNSPISSGSGYVRYQSHTLRNAVSL